MAQDSRQAAHIRWLGAAQLIGVMRAEPGITRAAAAQRFGIGSGGATELVARARRARLLDETPAPAQGRGRPTTVLGPHADGPLVWRLNCGPRTGDSPWQASTVILRLWRRHSTRARTRTSSWGNWRMRSARALRKTPKRIRALAVSVAGTISGARLVQFTSRGWHDVDLSALTAKIPTRAGVRLLLGNDATLAGLAEARTGAARAATTALHLIVAQGIGGTLVVNGEPIAIR